MGRNNNDIKAPDGFLLGGLRKVRDDGTVLFHRGYWQCPKEWAGERIWLHVIDSLIGGVEAAPPGIHIYRAQQSSQAVTLKQIDRPDAKPGYRNPHHKAWHASRQ